jgi:hypothetical protein
MNCEQANRLDLGGYLTLLGHQPVKTRGNALWYHSPLHEDKTPSFKVDRSKNTLYDFGLGKGGTLVDFVCALDGCDISRALQKIESGEGQHLFSFPPQKSTSEPEENRIKIARVSEGITDMVLARYLHQRNIPKTIAEKFCQQITYQSGEKLYCAIGFKNNAGGYELRSPNFKGSSSPKFISWLNNSADSVSVFEGFFDFLTYQSIHRNQPHEPTNFLVLNSLSFFTRSLLLMEKHERMHFYLDNDPAGKKCLEQALSRTKKVSDESGLYRGYKDLNEWSVSFGKQRKMDHSQQLKR